ncbi:SDR family oxidoreductase [Psychroflexus sediminis]|uniref:Nucleoside-diphosphate-sugar epimerase n=1 Tax=Psychroflexus sediminis TaxID=470826 RepID=A0A1G7U1Q0_9FLAO|nr:SDR family oxidoreductase [Psychroflexus sediminis]SDG41347.1 Nucleoside-diphosphate-sugar epimerase [Psychroflexus sediminis]
MNLLTGATGLVGAHVLAQLILNKEHTRALFRTEHKRQQALAVIFKYDISKDDLSKHVEWMACDILNIPKLEIAFKDITQVYHCAGFISNSPSDYKQMRKVNIEGTANMVNLSIDHKIDKFCHVSSIAAMGKPLMGDEVTEETPMAEDQKPSAYEISKYGAEMEVWRASQEGLKVVIVNPGIILGDGFYESGSGVLLDKLKKGLKFYPPKTTGFVGVYDVSKIMIQLMNSPIVNQRYLVVSENLSFKKVAGRFADLYDKPGPKTKLRPWMLYLAWCVEVLRSFFTSYKRQLTLEVIPSLFEDSLYSSEKIKGALHFKFETLEEFSKTIYERS